MNSAAAAPSRVRPRRRCVFPAVRRSGAACRSSALGANATPRGANPFARAPCREAFAVGSALARGKSFRSCVVSGGLRRGECFCAGQILSPVRRVGRPSPRRAFSRGANPFAFVPCREAFAEGRVPARGKSFRSCAVLGCFRRGECFCAGQILSLVRRVGRPSPRRAFSRGANPFARAPCRKAFAVGSVPAWGKPFRPCAVSVGLRRGECSCVGQTLSPVRRVGRPSPWGAFLRGANPFARAPCREAFVEESVLARGKSRTPPRAVGKPWRDGGSPPRGARRPAGGAGSACGLGGRSGPRVGLPKALLQ